MLKYQGLIFLSIITIFAYIFSISPFSLYASQLIAVFSVIVILFSFTKKDIPIEFIGAIISIIIFTTNGINSPAFFLVYFLLFILAFRHSPTQIIIYSCLLVLLLSQSLESTANLLSLSSLLLISPLAYFISKEHQLNIRYKSIIDVDHNIIIDNLDSLSQILSDPRLPPRTIDQLKKIKESIQSLIIDKNEK